MNQTARIISTYSADTFGVCSALFELDGMVVMHDPSGCNSTYTTHDEPRWYDMDSRIYISGLTEYDAIMGNDAKLVREVVATARAQRPRFIALLATPVPTMVGTDLAAVARLVQQATGLPCFTLATNSMHFYVRGVSLALGWLAEQVCAKAKEAEEAAPCQAGAAAPVVNLLGVTPLDFALNGSEAAMQAWLRRTGFTPGACWARGATLDDILASGHAAANLVVSTGGLLAARVLEAELGLPYVVGTPLGKNMQAELAAALRLSCADGQSRCCRADGASILPRPASPRAVPVAGPAARGPGRTNPPPRRGAWLAIGDSVFMQSLAAAASAVTGHAVQVICPLETDGAVLAPDTILATDEAELAPYLAEAGVIIADPMYQPVCPPTAKFVPLPHIGFSGRLYLQDIPNLVDGAENFLQTL